MQFILSLSSGSSLPFVQLVTLPLLPFQPLSQRPRPPPSSLVRIRFTVTTALTTEFPDPKSKYTHVLSNRSTLQSPLLLLTIKAAVLTQRNSFRWLHLAKLLVTGITKFKPQSDFQNCFRIATCWCHQIKLAVLTPRTTFRLPHVGVTN